MAQNKLILIGGMPASGKTTVGKQLASKLSLPFLDKDTLCDLYTNYVVGKETYSNDRASSLYTKTLRPLEYEILFHVAFEQVELGLSPVLVAPFSTEFVNNDMMDSLKLRLFKKNPSFQLVSILIEADPESVKERMTKRGRNEDSKKLENWDSYILDKILFQKKAKSIVDFSVNAEDKELLSKLLKIVLT